MRAPLRFRLSAFAAFVACAACGDASSGDASPIDGAPPFDAGTASDSPRDDAAPRFDAESDGAPVDATLKPDGSPPAQGLHVSGNRILDATNTPVRLLGVNRSGTEYACVQGNGFFDGPSDDASIVAMVGWKANAVRVPLNEDCWLAINGVAAQYAGAAYKKAIADYVALLLAHGIYPILELHWNAPGTTKAVGQQPMPDSDHAVTFWSEVASAYAGDGSVIFELYNEPYPDNNNDTTAAWTCWRDGGNCPSVPFAVAGMQTLVTAVRAAGAKNLVLLGGVQYSNALSQWLAFKPTDPENNLAAAWHVYNFNTCNNTTCYDQTAGLVAAQFPIVTTEVGEDDCAGTTITPLMDWLDAKKQSYLGWTWDTWGGCLVLVTDYAGTPAGTYGQTYKTHITTVPH